MKHTLVISTNKNLRYIILLFLYFIQGFPVGVFFVTIPAWLADSGASVAEIGYFSFMTTLPWTLKFINGFIIDRFVYLPMGRRRAWLLVAFIFIILTILACAVISPSPQELSLIASFSLVVMLFTAFQDTAIDAMAADLVQEDELSFANGLMFGGQIIGVASGTALIGYLISTYSFSSSMFVLAAVVGLAFIVMLFVRERPNEKLLPWLAGEASVQAKSLQINDMKEIVLTAGKSMLNIPSLKLVAILFLISLNYGIYLNIFPKLSTDLAELNTASISYIGGIASLVAGFVCIFMVGTLGSKFGRKQIIVLLLLIQCAMIGVGMFFQESWGQLGFLYTIAILAASTRYGLLTLIAAIAMSLCNLRVSATQFTLYLAFTNLGMAVAASIVGSIDQMGGFVASFLAYGGIAIVALMIAFTLKVE